MEINSTQLQQLNDYYKKHTDTNAVFLIGSKGYGKSTVIRNFLKQKKNVIHVSSYGKNNYIMEPIVTAINTFYSFKKRNHIFDYSNDLGIVERINMEIIEICRHEKMILYFENVIDYEDSFLMYIRDILNLLVNYYPNLSTFFVFDIDTDGVENDAYNKVQSSIYTVSPTFEFIPFIAQKKEKLAQYFNEIFDDNIRIAEKDLDYILDSCSGNLSYLNMIINYLKQNSIIIHNNDEYKCTEILPGSLTNILRDSIITRYNLLNTEMKQLLSQSSLIGFSFDTNMLCSSFHILRADEVLKRIEKISSLILEEERYSYRFENYEAHKIILESIEFGEKQQWNKILALYYEKQLPEILSNEKRICGLYKIAFHYKESLVYDKSIYYYILLIKMEIGLLDYKQALIFIQEVSEILIYINEKDCAMLEAILINYESECYKMLGQYAEAVTLYEKCLLAYKIYYSELELINLRLNLSYSQYMNGDLPKALQIALEVKEALSPNIHTDILLYRTLSFLASIFHLLGDDAQAEEYYVGSLTHCKESELEEEYYIQLKKASMIWDLEVAQPIVREAATYFEHHNKISCLAEILHNLATDSLYLLQLNSFEKECQKSIDLFRQYGSLLQHYPLNTMGIYKAMIQQDVDAAITIFKKILNYNIESFSQISIHTNLATCYRYKEDYDNCLIHIQEADSLIEQAENKDIIMLQAYHYINNALYYKAQGDIQKALSFFQQCFKIPNLQLRHRFFICNCMKDIYLSQGESVPIDVEKGCKSVSYPFIMLCAEREMLFATMRFYE